MRFFSPVLLLSLIVLASGKDTGSLSYEVVKEPKALKSAGGDISAIGITFQYTGINGPEFRLTAMLGSSMPSAVGEGVQFECGSNLCYRYGDYANVTLAPAGQCARVEWTSVHARRLEDCFPINQDGLHMYGGGETRWQYWPVNNDSQEESPYITGDYLSFGGGTPYGGLVENYWLLSSGALIHADEQNPLFLSWNSASRPGQLCLVSKDEYPYVKREVLTLKYTVCVGENVKTVHQQNFLNFYDKPTDIPDETMLIRPLWSTWAQYKEDVNQSIVLQFTNDVINYGFANSSHIEIDDDWETCYGEEEFSRVKFPDPSAMVQQIKNQGLKVTLWVHPFVNYGDAGCELFDVGVAEDYFVRDQKSKTGLTWWWQGENSGLIDVTRENATLWWRQRLERLRTNYGIDSFKFDAGETFWLPHSSLLEGDQDLVPNLYTTKYVDAVSHFGGLVEVRSARRNQHNPIFVRMLDMNSHWGYDNGLASMVPTLLLFSVLGYAYTLPDMIGGNAYDEGLPEKELYIRWMQANIFMPAVQFSLVPWNYDNETIQICLDVLAIREQHRDVILAAARQAVVDGSPINRPLWWIDPTDPITFTVDQEYMLGDSILVAPVVEQGATTRDIYLPSGSWRDAIQNQNYTGPIWLRNYPAPLTVVPYFYRQ